jgi:hypothetical protein
VRFLGFDKVAAHRENEISFSRTADFLVRLWLTARKSERNENFLSEETSFGNFLLAPYMPPLRIKKAAQRAAENKMHHVYSTIIILGFHSECLQL